MASQTPANDFAMPSVVEIERQLIATLLQQENAIVEVHKLVIPEAFYHPTHALIFQTIASNFHNKKSTAYPVIYENLKAIGAGEDVLIEAANLRYSHDITVSPGTHALLIFQKYIRRDIITASNEILTAAQDQTEDEFDLMDRVIDRIGKIHTFLTGAAHRSVREITESYYAQVLNVINAGGGVMGLKTHIPELDTRLGGLAAGRMPIIAGRPGTGKTAFIMQIINNICFRNSQKPVVLYSLEMSGEEIINRLVSCILRYPYYKISIGDIPVSMHDNFKKCIEFIAASNLHIVDNITDMKLIQSDLRLRKEKQGIELAIVDYVQLVSVSGLSRGTNREGEVAYISRSLKALAKELKIPILALVQLNREVEKRGNKRPQLADLRESGQLEQDADSVTFIFRPKHAGFDKDEDGNLFEETDCFLITAKNRHGAMGDDAVFCDIACNVFRSKESRPTESGRVVRNYSEPQTDDNPF